MWSVSRKSKSPSSELIHPPWVAGQYVTYVLEREDGSWVALALRLLGRANDGAWLLSADIKTPIGESTHWFRFDTAAPADVGHLDPIRQDSVRGSPMNLDDLHSLVEHPLAQGPLTMNLFLVRAWPAAAEALRGQPRQVHYPCGIDQVYPLVTSAPGFQNHHDLHPRVMLTGVACLSIDGGKNPMTVTSFGWSDPAGCMSATYEDFVDFSHMRSVDHQGFTLTYPATWFLRPSAMEKPGLQAINYEAMVGGNTCTIGMSVSLSKGSPNRVAEERETVMARLISPLECSCGRLLPRKTEVLPLPGNARGFVHDLVNPKINGLSYSAVFGTDPARGDRLAHICLFGSVAKANPQRQQTLEEMRRVFCEVLGSFRFAGA